MTVVVHYSGGALSRFWPMCLVVTLESADDAMYGVKRAAKNGVAVSEILPPPVPAPA